ncbi:MAG: hypothetical protein H6687_03365 [Bacillales bacterium]|nr:hypothetical protein [Bacillales bacterium]
MKKVKSIFIILSISLLILMLSGCKRTTTTINTTVDNTTTVSPTTETPTTEETTDIPTTEEDRTYTESECESFINAIVSSLSNFDEAELTYSGTFVTSDDISTITSTYYTIYQEISGKGHYLNKVDNNTEKDLYYDNTGDSEIIYKTSLIDSNTVKYSVYANQDESYSLSSYLSMVIDEFSLSDMTSIDNLQGRIENGSHYVSFSVFSSLYGQSSMTLSFINGVYTLSVNGFKTYSREGILISVTSSLSYTIDFDVNEFNFPSDEEYPLSYIVTYHDNYYQTDSEEIIAINTNLIKPSDPLSPEDGVVFDNWYIKNGSVYTVFDDFNEPVSSSLIIYIVYKNESVINDDNALNYIADFLTGKFNDTTINAKVYSGNTSDSLAVDESYLFTIHRTADLEYDLLTTQDYFIISDSLTHESNIYGEVTVGDSSISYTSEIPYAEVLNEQYSFLISVFGLFIAQDITIESALEYNGLVDIITIVFNYNNIVYTLSIENNEVKTICTLSSEVYYDGDSYRQITATIENNVTPSYITLPSLDSYQTSILVRFAYLYEVASTSLTEPIDSNEFILMSSFGTLSSYPSLNEITGFRAVGYEYSLDGFTTVSIDDISSFNVTSSMTIYLKYERINTKEEAFDLAKNTIDTLLNQTSITSTVKVEGITYIMADNDSWYIVLDSLGENGYVYQYIEDGVYTRYEITAGELGETATVSSLPIEFLVITKAEYYLTDATDSFFGSNSFVQSTITDYNYECIEYGNFIFTTNDENYSYHFSISNDLLKIEIYDETGASSPLIYSILFTADFQYQSLIDYII